MNNPFVSILIPIRNEGVYISRCLKAVLLQDYPKEQIEIIIIDGLSDDNTRTIIHEHQNEHSNIQLLDNPKKIVPTGMNIALRKALGKVIIRVDGHCIIAVDYVSKCIKHLQNVGVDGVGGPMESIGETKLSETIAVAMSSKFGVGNSAFRTTSGRTMIVDSVPFPAFTREIIEKAGFYDEELVRNQDDEYNYRIRSLGGLLLLADDVRSRYYTRSSLSKLWKQYFQYGYFKVRVFQKHPQQMSPRQFVPFFFVISLVTTIVFALFTFWGKWLLCLLGGSYLSANIISSTRLASKHGWKHLPLLPLIFLIIHLSYGLGFLIGLIKYWNRWGDKKGLVPES